MQRDDSAAPRVPTQPSTRDDDPVDTDDFEDPDPAAGEEPDDDVDTTFDDDLDGTDDAGDSDSAFDVAADEEPPELADQGKRILAFEKQWWRQAGAKEQAIHDTFNLSATRYYQLLNVLLDDPLALAHDPVVVQRLRRLRASRSRRR